MGKLIDLSGKTFGHLKVISRLNSENGTTYWSCECICGKITRASRNNLQSGGHTSCGCVNKIRIGNLNKLHGESSRKISKEYRTWIHMNGRCYTPTDHKYKNYGARGITVCDRWRASYENFLADMGRAPSPKHSLDRKENNGNYEPGNCRWTTNKTQANNKRNNLRLEYNGELKTLTEWCDQFGVIYTSAQRRRKSGKSFEEIFFVPYNQSNRKMGVDTFVKPFKGCS